MRHAFFECGQAKRIWAESEFHGIMDEILAEPPTKIFQWAMKKVGPEKLGFFICIAWAIWTWRNKKVLGGEEANLQLLVPAYLKLLEDFQQYASNVLEDPVAGAPPSFDKWYPPPLGWVKINTDAAIFRELGVGLGWVACDHHGRILEMG